MKVLLVSPQDLTRDSGVNKQIFGLAHALGHVGDEVHIAGHAAQKRPLGERVHGFFAADDGSKKRQKLIADQMLGLTQRESYDVVHVYDPLLTPLGRAAMNVPTTCLVTTFFAPPLGETGWLKRLLAAREPHLRRGAASLIATSQAVSAEVRDMFHRAVDVVPVGIDYQRFHPTRVRTFDKDAPLRVLFVGDPKSAQRGLPLLLSACKRIAETTTLHLEVVGGPAAATTTVVPGFTIAYLGRVTELRMPTLYQQADLVVAPALDKRITGSALLEAMASGTTVVASDVAPYKELCAGSGAVVFPHGNEDALVSAITSLAARPHERMLRGQANAQAAEAYRWDRLVPEIRKHYGQDKPVLAAPTSFHRPALLVGTRS